MDINTYALSRKLGCLLQASGKKLAAVESCTAGGLCHELTRVSGSSLWLEGGLVTYSNALKEKLVGVNPKTLATHGAISEAVASEMALGGLRATNTDLTVSITGVAGPTGGTTEKPVGLVWIAIAQKDGQCEARRFFFEGGRDFVRHASVAAALHWLIDVLSPRK